MDTEACPNVQGECLGLLRLRALAATPRHHAPGEETRACTTPFGTTTAESTDHTTVHPPGPPRPAATSYTQQHPGLAALQQRPPWAVPGHAAARSPALQASGQLAVQHARECLIPRLFRSPS